MTLDQLERSCAAAADLHQLRDAFLEYLKEYDSEYFTQFTLGVGGEMKAQNPFGCYMHPWPRHYVNRGFMKDDASLVRAFKSVRPVLWSTAYQDAGQGASVILTEARAFELFDGLVVPIRPSNGEVTIFTIGFKTGAPDRSTCAILRDAAEIVYERSVALDASWTVENSKLTAQQIRVLQFIKDGMSNSEISEALGISANTVKDHRKEIYQRLGVSEARHAIWEGYRLGLIEYTHPAGG